MSESVNATGEHDHRALQRALVIALHDPGFAQAMSDSPDAVLAPLGLPPADRTALARVDRRALATDPLRARRVLATLADEYPAATTLILAATERVANLDAFFASPGFRAAIMADRALAPVFGDYLVELAARLELGAVIHGACALEAARAHCRRAALDPPGAGVGLAPGARVLALDAAVLSTVQAIERWRFELGRMPQLALAADHPAPPRPIAASSAAEHVLVQASASGGTVTLTAIDADLFGVLAALATPRPRADAARTAHIPVAAIDALVADGILASGPGAGAPGP